MSKNKFKKNIAIDMVMACLRHYKVYSRQVDTITLSPSTFEEFKSGMAERMPDVEITDAVDFNDCKIRKGSRFMIKSLTCTLKPLMQLHGN